jgi:hypothetical protein
MTFASSINGDPRERSERYSIVTLRPEGWTVRLEGSASRTAENASSSARRVDAAIQEHMRFTSRECVGRDRNERITVRALRDRHESGLGTQLT